MTGGMYVTLSFVLELGVPLAILWLPMSASGGDADRRRHPQPAPVLPPAPEAVETASAPLPDCLMPRPLATVPGETRELEPA